MELRRKRMEGSKLSNWAS